MKKLLFFLVFFSSYTFLAQVGIGTTDPLSTLDINGNLSVKVVDLNGGPSGNATPINNGIYINLTPTSGNDEFYLALNPQVFS